MKRTLLVLYGSQTGTAEDVAFRVGREARRLHFDTTVAPMDAFDRSELLYQPAVVFVCATTGQGDEPDNMRHFWRFLLRKNLPGDSLVQLRGQEAASQAAAAGGKSLVATLTGRRSA
jgi:sulfite reductase alpha subunit-like flavoprotein